MHFSISVGYSVLNYSFSLPEEDSTGSYCQMWLAANAKGNSMPKSGKFISSTVNANSRVDSMVKRA